MRIKEHNIKKWFGQHLGVDFEINNWTREFDGKDSWTYYLLIHLDRIPKKYNPKSFWIKGEKQDYGWVWYKYHEHPIISEIKFHHGITWYSKEGGHDGAAKIIKIGCDYSHLWDEGHTYTLDVVKNDVIKTIESFLELIPDYKYRCGGNGKLYDLSRGDNKND